MLQSGLRNIAHASQLFHRGQLSTLGISDVLANQVKIYPNPATEVLTIEHEGLEITEIQITSMDGRLVLQKSPRGNNKFSINIHNLNSGNYLIRLNTNSGSIYKKFLKMN